MSLRSRFKNKSLLHISFYQKENISENERLKIGDNVFTFVPEAPVLSIGKRF